MATRILSALMFVCLTGLGVAEAEAQVAVDGYWRGNGTYVAPHFRTYPDGVTWNNYGRR